MPGAQEHQAGRHPDAAAFQHGGRGGHLLRERRRGPQVRRPLRGGALYHVPGVRVPAGDQRTDREEGDGGPVVQPRRPPG
eukprot:3085867-Lingulodinium_polyedra.AAC.1